MNRKEANQQATPLSEEELLTILENEKRNALGYIGGALSEQRRKALSYYNGELLGNEVEGRSQYVSTEVRDTIEWIMPSLLKIFTAGDIIVRFEPQGQEDEKAADQATDYINYIFQRQNDGFRTLYVWFKDALLQKNGFLKVYYEKYADESKEQYEGLTDDELALILQDADVEMIEHTATPGPEGETHAITLRKTKRHGKVCVVPVPPEEVLVSRDSKYDIKKLRYIGQRSKKTRTELKEMGFINVDDLAGDDEVETSLERFERNRIINDFQVFENDSADKTMKGVWVTESYLRVDFDGDGLAELRQVFHCGNRILKNRDGTSANIEVDTIPFVHLTPIIMPHRLIGMSVADLVTDIQELKTTYLRQLLDNMYLQNNPRLSVLEGMVNLDDLLVSRPGGIVRRSIVAGAIEAIPTPPLPGAAFEMLQVIDEIKAERSGVTKYTQGLDANSLNKTATGINQIMGAAQQRVELIARVFAETGVKDLFYAILELVQKHENRQQVVRLRNQWVPIDPREWTNRFDMTVSVGIGYGNKEQQLQTLSTMIQGQFECLKAGVPIVQPKNMYNAFLEIAKAAGLKSGDAYWTDPSTMPPQLPPQAMQQVQQMEQKLQQLAQENQQLKADRQVDIAKVQVQAAGKAGELQLEHKRLDHEKDLKTAEILQLDRHKKAEHGLKAHELNQNKARIGVSEDGQVQEAPIQVAGLPELLGSLVQGQQQTQQLMVAIVNQLSAPKVGKKNKDGSITVTTGGGIT